MVGEFNILVKKKKLPKILIDIYNNDNAISATKSVMTITSVILLHH